MTNRNDYTDDQLLHWYDLIMEFRTKHPTRNGCKRSPDMTKFCKRRGIDAKKMQWLAFRFFYKERNRPAEYKADLETVRMFHESGLSKKEFCEQYDVNMSMLSAADMHLSYKARLEKQLELRAVGTEQPQQKRGIDNLMADIEKILKDANDAKRMQAIDPQTISDEDKEIWKTPCNIAQSPKNDIAIQNDIVLLTKGISMTINPKIGQEKLIKIFEFLERL